VAGDRRRDVGIRQGARERASELSARAGVRAHLRAIPGGARQPGPWWNSFVMTFYTLQWSGVMVWLPTFLVQTRGARSRRHRLSPP
jgi:hypothetical protein